MGDFMSNNFVKRPGRLTDNLDLKTSNWIIKTKILASDSNEIILYNFPYLSISKFSLINFPKRTILYFVHTDNYMGT